MRHHAAGLRSVATVQVLAGRGSMRMTGVEAIRVPLVDARHPAIGRVTDDIARGRAPAEFERLRAALRDTIGPYLRAADRVVLHNVATLGLNLPLVAAIHDLAPTLPPGRLIVWVHDLAAPEMPASGASRAGEFRDLLVRPLPGARYVVVSEPQGIETARRLGLSPDAVRVVGNGLDVPGVLRLSAATLTAVERLGLRDADPLILLPARLVRRKRIEVAIEAAAVLRERGLNARLVVTGMPDPHDRAWRGYLEELMDRVATAGSRDILLYATTRRTPSFRFVADLYALADVLVFPSAAEGFGIPIAEAAAARVPIVCTDLPVFHSIAGDVPTYVSPDADGVALADAIEVTLAGHAAARLASRVRARLSWDRVMVDQVVPAILG